jgi:hypothetical protein
MQTYAYGHDFGNAETCGTIFVRNRKVSRSVPSAIAPGSLAELKKLNIDLKPNYFVFRGLGESAERYVGDLALEQSGMSFSGRGDINRYWSDRSLTMLLTVASSLIDEAEFGLNVVTGLPVQTYLGDPECRKKIKQVLEGTHVFSVNDRERIVHVKVERVIMEGAGAAIAYGSRDKMVQGIIDIGGRTTDLFVAKGQTPLRHLCTGKALGVEIAGDLLGKVFQEKYGRLFRNDEIRLALREHVARKPLSPVTVRGERITDLVTLVEESLDQIGNEIVSFVSSAWSESEGGSEVASSFSSILCIGGGAYYFYEQLRERIPNLLFIENPEEANSYGYAVFAEQQLQHLHIAV